MVWEGDERITAFILFFFGHHFLLVFDFEGVTEEATAIVSKFLHAPLGVHVLLGPVLCFLLSAYAGWLVLSGLVLSLVHDWVFFYELACRGVWKAGGRREGLFSEVDAYIYTSDAWHGMNFNHITSTECAVPLVHLLDGPF